MVPRIWLLLGVLAGSSLAAAADDPMPFEKLVELQGEDLIKAADEALSYGDKSPYTTEQLFAITEKLAALVRPITERRSSDGPRNPCGFYFKDACRHADARQMAKLIEIYNRFDPISIEKMTLLPVVAARVLEREVGVIAPQRLELAAEEAPVPAELKGAPEELKQAWRAYRQANAPFENAFPKPTEQIDAYANAKSFYSLVGEALTGATGLEDQVRRFAQTGANCLNVTDVEDAQDIAMLLMLIREGRRSEAVGAALRVVGTQGSTSNPDALAGPVIDLLKRSGLDWEEIFVGGHIEKEMSGGPWNAGLGSETPFLNALAKRGSPRAASFVKQLASFSKPDSRSPYVAIFNVWIETSKNVSTCKGQEVRSVQSLDEIAKPMPRSIQESLLHAIEELVTSESSETMASHAIDIFNRTQSRSSVPALKALARHSSARIAREAAKVLCAMGEQGPPPAAAPVRFQILVNGQPLATGERVDCSLIKTGDGAGMDAITQSDGMIEIPREHFTNGKKPATSLRLRLTRLSDTGMIFDAELSPPWKLDEVTKVDLKLGRLEIRLGNRDGLNAPISKKAFVQISRIWGAVSPEASDSASEDEGTGRSWFGPDLYRGENEVNADKPIVFPAVQEGSYEVRVAAPGSTVWHGIVTVNAKTTEIDATLQPGSDVRYEIVTPDGQRHSLGLLIKDGRELNAGPDYKTHTCRALPCGKYVLRIRGTDDYRKLQKEEKIGPGPDEIAFRGRDVAFTIEKGSPTLIDLGEIHLEKATAESRVE